MPEKYSLQEIVIFAIEIEKEGIIFYNKMSKKTANQKLKKVFQKLEGDEKIHQKKFENILNLLGPDKNEYLYHSENVYLGYLHAIIEKNVFDKSKVNQIIEKMNNDIDAINYAIVKEEDSIKFYENMKELTPKGNIPTIDIIISEEQLHIRNLLEVKSDL